MLPRSLVQVLFVLLTAFGANGGGAGPTMGALGVTVAYRGEFYTRVFHYAPDAPNIRHIVLVLPVSETVRAEEAMRVFQFLQVPNGDAQTIQLTPEGSHHSWVLPYLHVAPGGHLRMQLPPGKYLVAPAILAASVARADAGVTDDVTLYPGVTGGGLSKTTYAEVQLKPGSAVQISFILTDADGWG